MFGVTASMCNAIIVFNGLSALCGASCAWWARAMPAICNVRQTPPTPNGSGLMMSVTSAFRNRAKSWSSCILSPGDDAYGDSFGDFDQSVYVNLRSIKTGVSNHVTSNSSSQLPISMAAPTLKRSCASIMISTSSPTASLTARRSA